MNKIKSIFAFIVLSVVIYSCGDDSNGIDNPFLDIDHEELALSDNDSIVKFLKNYYYDASLDSVKTLVSGKTPLYDNIIKMEVKRNDIDYTLYVYKIKEGNPIDPNTDNPSVDKGYPSVSDSIFARYSGQVITSSTELSATFDSNSQGVGDWFSYDRLAVRGWSFGFENFKGGYLKKEDNGDTFNGPITYLEGGKGILFIPSGLAYTSLFTNNYSSSLVDQNLLFYIELLDFVKDTDHDNDGTPSSEEDNNGDGDLTNDFSDTDFPTTPDYLNPNV
ncbi:MULTISPECIES: peptidylprolyl isomerase [unclassified Polaribacter]|jgi:hypothetical protein|uniref:peptidylprolyl isomerase n=1 Tax=unclassified Polaribacter TaxID=196858 RepID=UPI001C4F041D|nr:MULTISPECIES: peptidylprolyl isomerase [unclassified Polaribacter]QXP67437.1 peptidylprolyl isomerase [Polaribacter sp. AHE13PA]QXP69597.1 peptidylprolyl isomerase [Polaribacter sp. R2A056_3_33]